MDSDSERMEEILTGQNVKIAILCTLLFVTLFFSFLPAAILYCASRREDSPTRRRRAKAVVSLLNCFAAGVFLGTCLLDLFPEVQENVEKFLKSKGVTSEFPLSEFFVVCGFLLLLSFEQVLVKCKGSHHHHHHHHNDLSDSIASTRPLIDQSRAPLNSYGSVESSDHSRAHLQGLEQPELMNSKNPELEEEIIEEEIIEQTEHPTDPSAHSALRYFMLAVALSLHSIFEGLALGLETNVTNVVQLFVALSLHKCIVAFSFGLNMVQSDLTWGVRIPSIIVFSLASPIGIGLGIGIEHMPIEEKTAVGVIGVLQGIACGTFLYIVFFELLPHEFFTRRKNPDPLLKVLALILGVTLMTSIMLVHPV